MSFLDDPLVTEAAPEVRSLILMSVMRAASDRHTARHQQMMGLFDGNGRVTDWDLWDRLSAEQDKDWAVVDSAARQMREMIPVA